MPRLRRLLRGALAMVLFLVPVALLAFAAREKIGPLVQADNRLVISATDLTRASGTRTAFVVLQEVSQPIWWYIAASVVCVWVWWRSRRGPLGSTQGATIRRRAVWAFVTMMVAWNLGLDAKLIVQRARPVLAEPLSHAPGYSFPSGHAFNITVIATAMVFLWWPLMSERRRRVSIGIAVAACLLVGLDRVFLGVHYPTDVVAGWVLGVGITFSSWIGFLGRTASTSSPGPSRPA